MSQYTATIYCMLPTQKQLLTWNLSVRISTSSGSGNRSQSAATPPWSNHKRFGIFMIDHLLAKIKNVLCKFILLITGKKNKFVYSRIWPQMGKQPNMKQYQPIVPIDLRKCTRQWAKCVFAVSWGASQFLPPQLFSLDFEWFSTECCEAEFGAWAGGSRSAAGPGSDISSMAWAGSKRIHSFSSLNHLI